MRMVYLLMLAAMLPLAANGQDSAPDEPEDEASEQVEQRDDSYRRQMELEDARSADRTYIDSTYTDKADLEKIDKLPKESRENIRDQLVDVIVENGEWEPSDALEEYPYEPSEAARSDADLAQREQEAWDEQIEKYHEREAAAFGAYRGPVPGPGNPTGQQGGQPGGGSQEGQQGSGQGGQQGDGQAGGGAGSNGGGSAGTYQPNRSADSRSGDEISTAGVSESALDFLRGGQGRPSPPQGDPSQDAQSAAAQAAADQADTTRDSQAQSKATSSEEAQAEQAQETPDSVPPDTRGIIAIEDLDKLEGTGAPEEPEDEEDPR